MPGSDFSAGMNAWKRHDWATAYEELRPLLHLENADPEQLDALGESAWWLGNVDDTIASRERAFAAYSAAGRNVDAAGVATSLAEHHMLRLESSVARGWMARAHRLLEGEPPTPALGHLRRFEAVLASGNEGGLDEALELSAEVEEIGRTTGDRDVEVLGFHDHGRFSISAGDIERGMALMEESMISAVAGEVSPLVTGRIYCNMIETCARMADYRRAAEWSDQAMRWCDELGHAGGYPGVCRIYRSELMRLRGAWSDAEAEATRAADELADFGPYMAAAFREIGMIRLNRGDLDHAEESFRKAHSLGSSPMPGLALLKLTEGDTNGALSMIEAALDGTKELLTRAKLLPSAIEIAIAARSIDQAGRYAEELADLAERYDSDLLHTFAIQGSARIATAQDRHADAVTLHRSVVDSLVAEGLPYEAARARSDLAMDLIASGSEQMGQLELDVAREEFEKLGADADLAQLAAISPTGTNEVRERIRTMMFTDIVESTSLIAAIGDDAWADLIAWHDRTLRGLFDTYDGAEVSHPGDGFFVTFDSPEDAAACAIEIQRVLRQNRKEAGFSPRVRIGIHIGEILESVGEPVGHEVHLAARVGAAAPSDQILLSEDAASALGAEFELGSPYDVTAKGLEGPVTVVLLEWA